MRMPSGVWRGARAVHGGQAGPVEPRIVGVGCGPRVPVGLRRHQPHRRIVRPLLAGVGVVLDLPLPLLRISVSRPVYANPRAGG